MKQYIANFSILAPKRQLEIIMIGYEYSNTKITKINTKNLFISQNKILQKRLFVKKNT